MNLCKFQNMDQCAKQYCDFWNQKRQACSLALEAHEKVELLERVNRILEKMEKINQKDAAMKLIDHLSGMDMQIH